MFDKEKKYFPIKTATACQNKWNWSTLWLTQGHTASCHRVNHVALPLEDFDNFHNLPNKIQEREMMLQGHWPGAGCEYCKDIEDAGGISDRIKTIKVPNLTPKELLVDAQATSVTPLIVEVFASNTCNLMCTYCRGANSSKIANENVKFGVFDKNGVVIKNDFEIHNEQKQYFEKFCYWLEFNSNELKELHILGGEPFIQRETNAILDILEKNENKNLELQIISNLMISHGVLKDYVARFSKMCRNRSIKLVHIIASIDCWGKEAEYVRSGLDLQLWEENFTYLLNQKWIKLHINQTITALSIRTMPALIEKLNEFRKIRPITQHFSLVVGDKERNNHMHPSAFGGEFWKNDFEKILSLMPTVNEEDIRAHGYMQGVKNLIMSSSYNDERIKRLHIYLDELDRRRGTNWRLIFPYLDVKI